MKTTVILDNLNVADIRPEAIASRYDRARSDEARRLVLSEGAHWCGRKPPTGSDETVPAFTKDGISYHHSPDCGSIFASPVPDQTALDTLTRDGEAARLRREYYTTELSAAQRKTLHDPLIRWLIEIVAEQGLQVGTMGFFGDDDMGALSLICDALDPDSLIHVDSVAAQASERPANRLISAQVQDNQFDLAVDLGALERRSDPLERVATWARTIAPGGYLAFTTTSASSLEYRVLGPNAPSFVALDRLTLFSIPALRRLLKAHGFECLELSTPGRVDIERLKKALSSRPAGHQIDFWQHALAHGSEPLEHDLQLLLQRNRLSSYVRVLARKQKKA